MGHDLMKNRDQITDEEVDKALDFLRDTARDAAQARANRAYVEQYRKTLKAQIMKEHGQLSAVLQEREAYSDDRYVQHLEAIREAVQQDEFNRFMREAASAKIQAWQTMSANNRSIKL